jgi:hypothetical protein
MVKQSQDNQKPSDDLTKMISRASNYMTLAYVKIPSVVLCLSYKGKGDRNIEDVHDFVFRMPMLEYRNKTWSNLDLALALKKDVIKALISHTGAIIGNKFSKHRPSTAQQSRLRELATSSVLLAPSSQDASHDNSSDASSTFGTSPTDIRRSERSRSPHGSLVASGNGLARTTSASSSVNSIQSLARAPTLSASMAMTSTASRNQHDNTLEVERARLEMDDASGISHVSANVDQEHHKGFMANTLARKLTMIGGKIRDRGEGISVAAAGAEDEENNRRKSRSQLGRKILGGQGDR